MGVYNPSVVLIVGNPGENDGGVARGNATRSIYQLLCDQFAGIDVTVYPVFGLINVSREHEWSLLPISAHGKDYYPRGLAPNQPGGQGALPGQLLSDVLRAVRGDRTIKDIDDLGHTVNQTYSQVFIVADEGSRQLDEVIELVQEQVALLDGDVPRKHDIYLMVIKPRPDAPGADFNAPLGDAEDPLAQAGASPQPRVRPWERHLVTRGGGLPVVRYAFVFSEINGDDRPTHLQIDDRGYAVAEALFFLLATGITVDQDFKNFTLPDRLNTQLSDRVGSMATSEIRFPRAEVELLSADMLASQIVTHVNRERTRNFDDEARKRQARQRARARADDLYESTNDRQSRLSAREYDGPSLDLIKGMPGGDRLFDQMD